MATNFKDQKKDTYYRMSWDEFKKICEGQGFEVMKENVRKGLPEVPKGEERLQMIHPTKKLTLICESCYGMQTPHSAVIIGYVRKREGVGMIACEQVHPLYQSYTLGPKINDIQTVTIDARAQMIEKLNLLEKNYEYPYVKDTNPNMDWRGFLELCKEQGFQVIGREYDKVILRHPEQFFILTAGSNRDATELIWAQITYRGATEGEIKTIDVTQNMIYYLYWFANCNWKIENSQILQPVAGAYPGKPKRL